MIDLTHTLTPAALEPQLERFWDASARKIEALQAAFDPAEGAPVFTVDGRYTSRG